MHPELGDTHLNRYAGKNIAVVGSGHSALNTLLDLVQLKETNPAMSIMWIMRKNRVEDAYGGETNDQLEARGELGSRIHQLVNSKKIKVVTPFRIQKLNRENGKVTILGENNEGSKELQGFDEI